MNALLLSLCLAIAVGNVPRAFQVANGTISGTYQSFFLGAFQAPSSVPSGQEELPTEAPHSTELLELGESGSLSEGRRVLRRVIGAGPFVTHTSRILAIVTNTRRELRNATFEHAFRNGFGAPIRC
ncbi:MAG: hypothetical protein ACO1RT_14185 [Planctomycetaceae bacterium]